MVKIAIVTGATGGIGEEFIKELSSYKDIDEIWGNGRNKEKLDKLKKKYRKFVAIESDLAADGVEVLSRKLSDEKPDVRMLVNNAGIAYMGLFEKMETSYVETFCKVNCAAPTELISAALPYMKEGAKILNISSASSFQPNPYLSMYSASKAFLRTFSRALNVELKDRGITVTCVCPGWVDTGMLPKEKDGRKIKYTGMISAKKVVSTALRDARKGKDMSTPSFFAKYFRVYSKVMPTKLVMKQWTGAIKSYI